MLLAQYLQPLWWWSWLHSSFLRYAQGSVEWENTITGYFLDKKLPYSLVHTAASKMWKKLGLFDILATDSGQFFFKFNTRADCDAVLEGCPWHIASKPIILRKWQPGLNARKKRLKPYQFGVFLHIFLLSYGMLRDSAELLVS